MITSYSEAIDEMFLLFNDIWLGNSASIVGYVPEIRWQNVEESSSPDASKFWARVSTQTVFEEQSTLSTCEGLPGQKRYTVSGLIFVQIFCPRSNVQANEFGKKLAELSRNSFRGKSTPGNVWFRNARINELAPEDSFYRFNVVAEFEYDELG